MPSCKQLQHEARAEGVMLRLQPITSPDACPQDAATELRVSATTLKKICRAQGVQRWPYRKRNHVQQLLKESAQLVSHKPNKKREAGL